MTPAIHRMGDRALLVETANPAAYSRTLARLLAGSNDHRIIDIVPAAATVLVRFASSADVDIDLLMSLEPHDASDDAAAEPLVVPVRYDGEDLASVAEHAQISVDEVIGLHCEGTYTVDFCGFAPGFGYLSGVHALLQVPRRQSPRTRVPAGSVALAAGYTAIYPGESPGGWNLIGRTTARMFDPWRDPPALLTPGRVVAFTPVDELAADSDHSAPQPIHGEPTWEVVRPAPAMLLQDLGRPGHGSISVGSSGAFDRGALRFANRLVGNADAAAGLEIVGAGLTLRALRPGTVAFVGPDPRILVDGRAASGNAPLTLTAGQQVQLAGLASGVRCYIAFRGGVLHAPIIDSLSYDTLAGLGPRPLVAGDTISVGRGFGEMLVDHHPWPSAATQITLRALPGPRADWMEPASLDLFYSAEYAVSVHSDRVGVRLEGPRLRRVAEALTRELPPEGLVPGAVQVPPDGQPIIMGPDHPVTGGYPVIAVIQDADVDLLAQARPGTQVRFTLPK